MKIEKFEDLEIWQLGRQLSKVVFLFTCNGEFKQDFRFKYQIRSAAGSVMDNVAEGYGRGGNKEFINFLLIARGSAEEVKSQLYRALDSNYISEQDFNKTMEIAGIVVKKITNLITYLQKSEYKGTRFNSAKEADSFYSLSQEIDNFPDLQDYNINSPTLDLNREQETGNSEPGTGNRKPETIKPC